MRRALWTALIVSAVFIAGLALARPARAQDEVARGAEAAHGASGQAASLSVRPPADWRGGLWEAPGLGETTAQREAGRDTTGGDQIDLQTGFFRADRFVHGEREPQKVFTTFGLRPEFEQTLGQHPEALREAKKASTYKALAFAASIASAVGAGLYLFNSSRVEVTEQGVEDTSNNGGLGLFVGGAVVSVIGGVMARSRVRDGVQLFNEHQRAGGRPSQTTVPAEGMVSGRSSEALDEVAATQGAPSAGSRAGLESWYTYWGLGWANPGYPGEVEPTIEQLRDTDGVSNAALNLDLLGFYFPLGGDKTLVGGIVNAAGERFEVEGESFQVNQYLYSASAMHFFGPYIGNGFFARGDVGLARVVVDSSFAGGAASESGFGFLLGGGYAFPVASGTRLLLNASYARRSVEGESYSAITISVGGLF